MTTPSPAEQLASDISSLQSRINSLQDSVRLNNTRQAIESLQTAINGMTQQVASLRRRGYALEKELEGQAADFAQQWGTLYPSLLAQVNQQSFSLQAALNTLTSQMVQVSAQQYNPAAARPLLESLRTGVSALEGNVSAAERQVEVSYQAFNNQVNLLKVHLADLEWMVAQLAEAKFTLLPTESGIAAVKAVWDKDVKAKDDDPQGVLYLTDQRLLFEQKEEIVTKKVLFIATEKQKVQELKWEVPVTLLEEIKPSKQGLMKNEDHLDLRFGSGAPIESIHLHIWQDGNFWLQLLNRARSKDFDKTRAIPIDQAEVEKARSAPAQCPSCGGSINQVVLRGQGDIKCEYCGFVIRL